MIKIKPDERVKYSNLLSSSQLRKIGLMPAAAQEPDACVVRQFYKSYFLYDKSKCIPYSHTTSDEERERRKIANLKRKKLYTCPVCNKYQGAKSGFDSSLSPGMCKACFTSKREEYISRIGRIDFSEKFSSASLPEYEFYEFVVIDTETTGLSSLYDEILQLCILSDTGKVLFYETFSPYFTFEYPEASAVNGLSYENVKNFPYIFDFIPKICEILSRTRKIVGYNVDFDVGFLRSLGMDFGDDYCFEDVMQRFAEYYGEYDEKHGSYRWKNLSFCAAHLGYEFKAHDSKEDCKATLFAYKFLTCNIGEGTV